MTLCKKRPQRTYDAQYIFDQHDVSGTMKKLGEAVGLLDGDMGTFFMGAYEGLDVFFSLSDGEIVDTWEDFLAALYVRAAVRVGGTSDR